MHLMCIVTLFDATKNSERNNFFKALLLGCKSTTWKFKGGVRGILLQNKTNICKSDAAQSSLLSLCLCVLVTVYGDTPPSACILTFWLTVRFPQPMTAGRWGWEQLGAQRLDAVQTGESYECGRSAKKRKYSPSEQADKTCSRARVSLGLASSRFGALKERLGGAMQSWAALWWTGRC